jgi:hypothetical protein
VVRCKNLWLLADKARDEVPLRPIAPVVKPGRLANDFSSHASGTTKPGSSWMCVIYETYDNYKGSSLCLTYHMAYASCSGPGPPIFNFKICHAPVGSSVVGRRPNVDKVDNPPCKCTAIDNSNELCCPVSTFRRLRVHGIPIHIPTD